MAALGVYARRADEGEVAYQYRICSMKDSIGTWDDVADLLNETLGHEYGASKYRKDYQIFQRVFESIPKADENEELEELKEQRRQLQMERVRLRDERTETARLLREKARQETLQDIIRETVGQSSLPRLEKPATFTEDAESDLIVSLADLHYGICVNTPHNRYNPQIFAERLVQYLERVKQIGKRHKAKNCYVCLLGDEVSGLIHTGIRLENNENVIQQVMDVSELLAEFVYDLAQNFDHVYIASVAGNHSRVLPQKDEIGYNEHLDNLIPFYLEAKLQNCDNVCLVDPMGIGKWGDSLSEFNVRGHNVVIAHGDKDSASKAAADLTLFLKKHIDIIMLGHRHFNAMTNESNIKVCQAGSFSGPDNFCTDHRLSGQPEQMVLVVNDTGIDAVYDVKLN